jgi:hypothetical protein
MELRGVAWAEAFNSDDNLTHGTNGSSVDAKSPAQLLVAPGDQAKGLDTTLKRICAITSKRIGWTHFGFGADLLFRFGPATSATWRLLAQFSRILTPDFRKTALNGFRSDALVDAASAPSTRNR